MNIVLYPSEILLKPAKLVTVFDSRLAELCDSMLTFMTEKQGLGLAAPQINESRRVFVMKRQEERLPHIIAVNPEVRPYGEPVAHMEGCLSMPNVFVQVVRPRLASLQYQDPLGVSYSVELADYDAFCAQHEADHLDGIFFTSRVSRQMRRQALREWEKIKLRYT